MIVLDAIQDDVYTTEYIFSLPENCHAELVDGVVYDMAPPGLTHQRISMRLATGISRYLLEHHGECEVFSAPFGVFLCQDDRNYLEPDISVICDKTKLSEKGCQGAPDWVIEIVSPTSRYMDYVIKLVKYQNAGVREYWIVDPEKEVVLVYNFEKKTMLQYSFGEKVPAGIYDGLELSV